ncbi:formimidoylglutamate deiminase [Rhodobacteraceae bacterium NNCM2]|nr:formimidoylglutamate deiminase [Coraliihabitans acroporae]
MTEIWAKHALLDTGWARNVRLSVGSDGTLAAVEAESAPSGQQVDLLLFAPVNLHSHVFQRAMAGLTEARGPDASDSFWTWRSWMYRFVDHLTPEEVEAIAAFVQMEMLEAGYGAVAEFHYLHHRPGGASYDNPAEMAARVCAAAETTGIGLTMLPVLYTQGGCDGRALTSGQQRFGNDVDGFARLMARAREAVAALPPDARIGTAPHSLRAVNRAELEAAVDMAGDGPIHIHIAEQTAEIDEVSAALGARPVEWLLATAEVGPAWCLIHATHMTPQETTAMAASGAVAGLCPITEANLGDGIFDGARFLAHGGAFGMGSDSNVNITLAGELRQFEYAQRLGERLRAVLARPGASCGRVLLEGAARGGAQAAQRGRGAIAVGEPADLLSLDLGATDFIGREGDAWLDAFVFARAEGAIRDVWSAGRHVVQGGAHIRQREITGRYRAVLSDLLSRI